MYIARVTSVSVSHTLVCILDCDVTSITGVSKYLNYKTEPEISSAVFLRKIVYF